MSYLPTGLLAQTTSTTKYELTRLAAITSFWHFLALVGVCLAVLVFVIWMYVRDSRELPVGVAITLTGLRLFAFAALLFTFLGLERRTEREVVQNSRVVVLVDASQSMGLTDTDSSGTPGSDRRIDLIVREFTQGSLLPDLRKNHDVMVMRFDESEQPTELASYTKLPGKDRPGVVAHSSKVSTLAESLQEARVMFGIGAGLLAIAILGGLIFTFSRRDSEKPAVSLLVGAVCLIVAVVVLAVANLRNPDIGLLAIAGQEDLDTLRARLAARLEDEAKTDQPVKTVKVNWEEKLVPGGNETRLGEAVMHVISKQRGGPVAGVVLISDGRNNAGLPYTDAVTLAREADMPVHVVGMGSNQRPMNVGIVDIEAPERVYPGDRFNLTGYVQAFEMDGRSLRVELFSYAPVKEGQPRQERFEDDLTIRLKGDGALAPVKFEIEPSGDLGRRAYALRIEAPRGDHNGSDNEKSTVVEIVERRSRVLLFAGGPTREYRFLRNQLYRDEDAIVHVYLQTGRPGISQEADTFDSGEPGIYYGFPDDPDVLAKYDCLVAFDPDWQELDDAQIRMVEEWVDKEAGGLIVVAGPVFTPVWARKRRGDLGVDILKSLYPVVFYSRGTSVGLGRFGAEETAPLQFTREGLETEFLWLEDNAIDSEEAWAAFDGVYGYYAVKDAKLGATVYARFGDEGEALGGEMPIYMAGHFYGSGLVFYMASGEMWRMRKLDHAYFERFYTKLIRHVTQGRLLRDSEQGVLLVEQRRYKIGDQVPIRAQLKDAQRLPLDAKDVPEVTVDVQLPDGTSTPVKLRNVNLAGGEEVTGREGLYVGQLAAVQQGDYRLVLKIPGTADKELTKEFRVRAPRKEIERPERNDELLRDLAGRTGGEYFNGIAVAAGRGSVAGLAGQIEIRDRLTPLPDLPDKSFEEKLMWWQLALVAGALCLEWLIRRMSKLA